MSAQQPNSRQHYHVGNLAEQLLSSARIMLEEVGVAKLSMRALCSALGVTATAAYHHFTNRAELLAQLATQGYLELLIHRKRILKNHTFFRDFGKRYCS